MPNPRAAEIVIEPRTRPELLRELAEVWRHRELLRVLVRRDLTVRYRETLVGGFWAVLQPLALMTVFWLALGQLLRASTGSLPYPLYVLIGLLPWMFFANSVSASMTSLVGAGHLIQKVWFPRLIIPLSTLGVALVDFAVGCTLLVVLVALQGFLGVASLAALVPLALIGIAAVAVGTLSAALAAAYRDTRYMIPLLMQIWMFATPVFYPADIIAPSVRWVIELNPMAPLIDGFRHALVGAPVNWAACAASAAVFGVALWASAWFFMRIERRLSDTL
jgi:lipopolysaccharide transport system permease protein